MEDFAKTRGWKKGSELGCKEGFSSDVLVNNMVPERV